MFQDGTCPRCGVNVKKDPVNHFIEEHQIKTLCYECPWCGNCDITLNAFERHLKRHTGYDPVHFRHQEYLMTGLTPFRALLQCSTCEFRCHTVSVMSKHEQLIHKTQVGRPKVNPKGKHFPFADVQLCEKLERNDWTIQSLKDALALVQAQLHKRKQQPEIQDVNHVVALRGDLLTHRATAYAHVFIELFVVTGDYVLHSGHTSIPVTIRNHHACPALVQHQTTSQSENPKQFTLSGMLHIARGPPVVWYVFSAKELPSPGQWRLLDTNARVVSCVTVDCDRVLV